MLYRMKQNEQKRGSKQASERASKQASKKAKKNKKASKKERKEDRKKKVNIGFLYYLVWRVLLSREDSLDDKRAFYLSP